MIEPSVLIAVSVAFIVILTNRQNPSTWAIVAVALSLWFWWLVTHGAPGFYLTINAVAAAMSWYNCGLAKGRAEKPAPNNNQAQTQVKGK